MRRPARDTVSAILAELRGRKGFDWWWHDIDPETKREIEDALVDIVRGHDDSQASEDRPHV